MLYSTHLLIIKNQFTPVNISLSINEPTTQPDPVGISLSVTASGTNTAGETYSLECSATVTGSTDQPTITWLDPMNNPVPSEMVTTTGSMSTLTFNPLAASHAGTYTCRAMVGGVTETQTSTVIVNGIQDFVCATVKIKALKFEKDKIIMVILQIILLA